MTSLQSTLLALLFTALAMPAKAFDDKNYDWEKSRKPFEISEEDASYPAILLKRYQKTEVFYDKGQERPVIYRTFHVIIRVNSSEAIDEYNKIHISTGNMLEMIRVKARSINSKGEILELSKKDMRDVDEDEDGDSYKLFAFEGLEAGSEVEYYFIIKRPFNITGRDFMQSDIPWKNVHYEIVSPSNLVYKWKGYNNLPQAIDSATDKKNRIILSIPEIEPLESERFAKYNTNKMRMEYYLAYNTSHSRSRIYALSEASQVIFASLTNTDKKDVKAVQKMLKQMKLDKDPEKQIMQIENYLKTNLSIADNLPTQPLAVILQRKYGSEIGVIRVYIEALKQLDINYQIVVTSSRNKVKFDPDLDAWCYLEEYMLYFPDFDKYLRPKSELLRYGLVPSEYTATYGLFIRPVSLGGQQSGVGKVEYINPLPYDLSYNNIIINAQLADDEHLVLDIEKTLGGLHAVGIQPIYPFIKKDKQDEITESMVKMLVADADIISMEAFNIEMNTNPLNDPYRIKAQVKSQEVIERAGPNLLFKIGTVIGPQSELYQDKERKLDVENDFNRTYNRTITFTIPDGYTIKNPEDLSFDVHHTVDGDKVFVFETEYTINGSTLEVNIVEYYKNIRCPKEDFGPFRAVINAAADFNKVVLVLEKS